MHYTSIVAGLALLPAAFAGPVPASGAPLHALAARSDPHKLDFRTFGASGCSAKNQGVYTLLQSDAGACRPFAEPIGSLLVGDNLCTLTVYQDGACSTDPLVAPTGVCQNGQWQSYKMTC